MRSETAMRQSETRSTIEAEMIGMLGLSQASRLDIMMDRCSKPIGKA
jgi:hypothetical protein